MGNLSSLEDMRKLEEMPVPCENNVHCVYIHLTLCFGERKYKILCFTAFHEKCGDAFCGKLFSRGQKRREEHQSTPMILYTLL